MFLYGLGASVTRPEAGSAIDSRHLGGEKAQCVCVVTSLVSYSKKDPKQVEGPKRTPSNLQWAFEVDSSIFLTQHVSFCGC